jgi:hypothetical protein
MCAKVEKGNQKGLALQASICRIFVYFKKQRFREVMTRRLRTETGRRASKADPHTEPRMASAKLFAQLFAQLFEGSKF